MCVYIAAYLTACVSWFKMSAFNSHPLWFLFCSAQEEADGANLQYRCSGNGQRCLSVRNIGQAGRLPRTAYKETETEAAEVSSLSKEMRDCT